MKKSYDGKNIDNKGNLVKKKPKISLAKKLFARFRVLKMLGIDPIEYAQ